MNNHNGNSPSGDGGTNVPIDEGVVLLVVSSENAEDVAANLQRDLDQVIIGRTIQQALSHLSTREIDCIISEYKLSDGSGIQFLETVRTDYPSLPFILWTESGSESIASKAIAADVTEYIPKREGDAIDYDSLINRVRDALAEYQSKSTVRSGDEIRHLFSNICCGLIEAETRDAEFRTVLQEVCNATAWEYGEVWIPDDTRTHLRCPVTYDDTDRFEEFVEITESMTFKSDEGLPGRVWESEASEWDPDVSLLPTSRYRRASLARQAGLKTAVGVPIEVADSIESVLVFYATTRRTGDSRNQCLVETASALLSTYLEQDQPESGFLQQSGRTKELKRRRELLRHTEELARTGGWEADLETGEQRWTEGTRAIHDVSSDFEPTVEVGIDFFHPDDRDTIERVFNRCAETGEPYDVELRLVTADDRIRWVRATGVAVRENGEISKIRGAIQDITERKEREQKLEQLHGLLNRTERIADVGGWEFDPETGKIFWTEHVSDLLGVDYDEEPPLDRCLNTYHEEDRPIVENAIETALETGDSFDVEVRFRRPGGEIRWLRVQGVPTITDGEVVTLRGAVQDTTERKERERELDATRKRYRTLIEAAPDPIFVADAETGEIIEANTAAAAIRNQPLDELIGMHETELHPETDADRYRELFEQHVEHNGTSRQIADGSPIYMETSDGERIPVSVSAATIELDDRTLIHGIFRDISEQQSYEESLKGINSTTRQLLEADTDTEIAQTVVEVAADVLDISGVGIFLYDGDVEELVPVAYSDVLDDILGEVPRFTPGEGIAWRVFISQEPANFEDVRTAEDVYNPGTPIRRELIYPLGDHGVLIAGDTEVGGFCELTIELVEILTVTAQAALNRAERTQQLRERERDARKQAEQLERVEQLNEEIRTIIKAVVQAGSRESVRQIVCDSLCTLDHFESVWIGESNLATNDVTIKTTAGAPEQYLEAVPLDLTSDSALPTVRAIRDRKAVVESNLARRPSTDEWRSMALLHEYRSIISVPILYEDVLYGSITICSNQADDFDDLTKSVLTELGELIGYALNTITQRNALLEEGTVDLTFEILETEDIFVNIARELATPVQIKNICSKSENSSLVHFSADGVDPEQLRSVVQDVVGVENVEVISDEQPPLFEVTVVGECIATKVANLGANIRSITVIEDGCEIRVSIPQNQDIQVFNRYLADHYSDITLTTQQDETADSSQAWMRVLSDNLTERQQDILVTAYYSGYFDRPRKRTGVEIAESFGISQPAFAKQLRVAQYNLLTAIIRPS